MSGSHPKQLLDDKDLKALVDYFKLLIEIESSLDDKKSYD
jgi:hypothetical protein